MTPQLFTLFWIISNILTFHFYTFSVIYTFCFYIAFEELTFYQNCSIKCVLYSLFYIGKRCILHLETVKFTLRGHFTLRIDIPGTGGGEGNVICENTWNYIVLLSDQVCHWRGGEGSGFASETGREGKCEFLDLEWNVMKGIPIMGSWGWIVAVKCLSTEMSWGTRNAGDLSWGKRTWPGRSWRTWKTWPGGPPA